MEVDRILVATDLLEKSAVTYAHVAAFVRAFPAARVDIVHVDATVDKYLGLLDQEVLGAYRDGLREVTGALLARHGDLLASSCRAPATCHLAEGKPWREILRTAETLDASLVVVNQSSQHEPLQVGSTTKRVLRRARGPVLIVDPSGYQSAPTTVEFRRVFFATDFSPHADRGLVHAIDLARRFSAELILVHVEAQPHVPQQPRPSPVATAAAALAARLHELTGQRMAAALQLARGAGVRAESRLIPGGKPAIRLVEAADEETDLIVIPSHGRSATESVLLGSVTERVLRRTQRPLLVLRRGWLLRSQPPATGA